jgi:hypothetical protein
MFTIYYPSNWSVPQIMEYEASNNLRHIKFSFGGLLQYYPKGLKKTEWHEIIWDSTILFRTITKHNNPMKTSTERVKPPEQFIPVKLIITLESQTELDFFGSLFNFAPLSETCENYPELKHLSENFNILYRVLSQNYNANIHKYIRTFSEMKPK